MTHKSIQYEITSVRKNQNEYTPLDYDKKHFTDYNARFKKGVQDYGRKVLFYGRTSLKYRFQSEVEEAKRAELSIFEHEEKSKTPRSINEKDYHVDGIYAHYSINELIIALNAFSAQNISFHYSMKMELKDLKKKSIEQGIEFEIPSNLNYKAKGLVISKRLMQGGISIQNNSICQGSPFLFFDVDVKPKENPRLYTDDGIPNKLNTEVFKYLKTIALITARSASGLGICGIMYVPSLENVTNNRRHKSMGMAVYDYINNKLDLPCKIKFDDAQAQFTQGRSFPVQFYSNNDRYNWDKIELNKDAIEFKIESIEVDKELNEVKYENKREESTYTYTDDDYNQKFNNQPLIKKYNKEHFCYEIFMNNGYEITKEENSQGYSKLSKVGKINDSISLSSNNTFKCFTSSLKGFTPFDLLSQLEFNGDSREAYNYVKSLYEEKNTKDIFDSKSVLNNWELIDDEDKFYDHPMESLENTYSLVELNDIIGSNTVFSSFKIDDNGKFEVIDTTPKELLGITERDIELSLHRTYKSAGYEYPILDIIKNTDICTTLEVEGFLTTDLIIKNCTSYINYIYAGCGLGKTTTFLGKNNPNIDGLTKDFSVLFIVPRKMMVEQQALTANGLCQIVASTGDKIIKTNDGIEYIQSIGNNSEKLYDDKNNLKSVILTYDQFVHLPNDLVSKYDYIVFDEAHLLTSDSYREAIPKSFLKIEEVKKENSKAKFILLSATPSIELLTISKYHKNDFKLLNIVKSHKETPSLYVHNFIHTDRIKKDIQIFEQVVSDLDQGKKVVIFCENKNQINLQWNKLEEYCNDMGIKPPSRSYVSSESKELDLYKELVKNENLNVDLMYSTSVLNVGVNISSGVEKGVSFIFDYSSNNGYDTAIGQIQLLFRNRSRLTEIHCFSNLMDTSNPNLFKINKPAIKNDEVNSIFAKNILDKTYENKTLAKSTKYSDVSFSHFEEVSDCATATFELNEQLITEQKRLDTFIKQAVTHDCKVYYVLNSDTGNSKLKTGDLSNEFSLNVINELLTLDTGQRIYFEKGLQSTADKIEPTFSIDQNSLQIRDEIRCYQCAYHSAFHPLLQKIRRSFNTLMYYYREKDKLKDVFNFIINTSSKKAIDKRIVDYINTYKTIHEDSIITQMTDSVISSEGDCIDKIILRNILNTIIPNQIISHFSNNLSGELIKGNYQNVGVITEQQFQHYFKDHIIKKVNDSFSKLYRTSTSKTDSEELEIESLQILESNRKIESDLNDSPILSFLGFDTHINSLNNADLFEKLLKELSDKYPREGLNQHILVDYKIEKDNFNSNKTVSISINDFYLKYDNELSVFREKPENRRSKFCYAIIDNETEKVIIEKSMKLLHSTLSDKGILSKMVSPQNYNFEKLNNFNKTDKLNSCRNYTVIKKIPI